MTNIEFDTSRRAALRRTFLSRVMAVFRKGRHFELRDLFRLSSLTLVLIGSILLILGAVCRSASALPEWAGIAPVTAGMVILIFLTGRHS